MRSKLWLLTMLFMTSGFILFACNFPATTAPTNPEALFTQAAETVRAQITGGALQTVVSTPIPGSQATVTSIAIETETGVFVPDITQGNETPVIPVYYPTPTEGPILVPITPLSPELPEPVYIPPQPVQVPCNMAEFVKDVTVPDGSVLPPHANFTKVWRVRNTGGCVWNSNYDLVLVDGNAMRARDAWPLPGRVRPGEVVDLAIDLVAPDNNGKYWSYYMLRAPDGGLFGLGSNADKPFWVNIRVFAPLPSPRYTVDFVVNMCAANWTSGAGRLPCPGDSEEGKGAVIMLNRARLEDGRTEDEPILWTVPEDARNGWIAGTFPSYTVKSGDHFVAEVGCLWDSHECNVTFNLDYQIDSEPVRNLGAWREYADGKTTLIDIDLSTLAGRPTKFILGLTNNNWHTQPNVFWLGASIRSGTAPTQAPGYTPTSTLMPTLTPTLLPTAIASPTLSPTYTATAQPTPTPTLLPTLPPGP